MRNQLDSSPILNTDAADVITVLKLANRRSFSPRSYAYVTKDAHELIHIAKVIQIAIISDNLLGKFCKLHRSLLIGAQFIKKDSTLILGNGNKVALLTQKPSQLDAVKYCWVALSRKIPL